MSSTDLVAELRAEVTCWCRKLQEKHEQMKQSEESSKLGSSLFSSQSAFSPFSSLTPQFRLISQGHELTPELDEKSLGEVGFKDLQVSLCKHVYVAGCRFIMYIESQLFLRLVSL